VERNPTQSPVVLQVNGRTVYVVVSSVLKECSGSLAM